MPDLPRANGAAGVPGALDVRGVRRFECTGRAANGVGARPIATGRWTPVYSEGGAPGVRAVALRLRIAPA